MSIVYMNDDSSLTRRDIRRHIWKQWKKILPNTPLESVPVWWRGKPTLQSTRKVMERGGRWCFRRVIREGFSEKIVGAEPWEVRGSPWWNHLGNEHSRLWARPCKGLETGINLGCWKTQSRLVEWDSRISQSGEATRSTLNVPATLRGLKAREWHNLVYVFKGHFTCLSRIHPSILQSIHNKIYCTPTVCQPCQTLEVQSWVQHYSPLMELKH